MRFTSFNSSPFRLFSNTSDRLVNSKALIVWYSCWWMYNALYIRTGDRSKLCKYTELLSHIHRLFIHGVYYIPKYTYYIPYIGNNSLLQCALIGQGDCNAMALLSLLFLCFTLSLLSAMAKINPKHCQQLSFTVNHMRYVNWAKTDNIEMRQPSFA